MSNNKNEQKINHKYLIKSAAISGSIYSEPDPVS